MRLRRACLGLLIATLLISGWPVPTRADAPLVQNVYIAGRPHGGQIGDLVNNWATLQVTETLVAMGVSAYQITWSPPDQTLTIHGLPESPILIKPGDRVVRLKERSITLPIAPYIKDSMIMLPLDFYRQVMNARVEWVTATREIEVTPYPYNQVGEYGPTDAGGVPFHAIDQDSAGRLYLIVVAGRRAGIWRSSDQGATWERLEQGIGLVCEGKFVFGKRGEVYLIATDREGLWQLVNDRHWQPVAGLEKNPVLDAALLEDGTLWVSVAWPKHALPGLGGGAYYRDPQGGAWVPAGPGSPLNHFAVDAAGRLWAATEQGLYRREGEAWRPVAWEGLAPARQILPSRTEPNWLWAVAGGGVLASQDGGQSWQDTQPWGIEATRWAAMRLVQGTGSELFLLTGSRGVRYSPNGGGEWYRLTGYWPDAQVLDAAMVGDRLFLATTGAGVIIPQRMPQPAAKPLPRLAPQPVTWGASLTAGYSEASTLALDPQVADTAYAFLTPPGGIGWYYKTTDGGRTWQPITLKAFPWLPGLIHHPTQSNFYIINREDGWHLTRDGGLNWVTREHPGGRSFFSVRAILASGRVVGAIDGLAGSRVLYTDDFQTWQDAVGAPTWHLTGMVANPAVPDRLYACDWSEQPCRSSADGGATWQPLGAQPPREQEEAIPLNWSPLAPTELLAGRYVSRDGGQSWQPLPFFQPGEVPHHLAINPTNPSQRAAIVRIPSGQQQLWWSPDAGQSWVALRPPTGASRVVLAQYDKAGRLWVVTDRGIYRLG